MKTIRTKECRIERMFYDQNSQKVYKSVMEIPGSRLLDASMAPIYLTLGYIPGNSTLFEGVQCLPGSAKIILSNRKGWHLEDQLRFENFIDYNNYHDQTEENFVSEGINAIFRAVEMHFKPNKKLIVPLSGGLDSRAVLGLLLEFTTAKNIATFTRGTPGTFDYEIGSAVAKKVGVKHYYFNLSQLGFSQDRLETVAKLTDGNINVFYPMALTHAKEHFGHDCEYWSGFLGDHFQFYGTGLCTSDYAEALVAFGREYFIPGYGHLFKLNKNLIGRVLKENVNFSNEPNLHEQMNLYNLQERNLAHQLFLNTLENKAPFASEPFLRFQLNLPSKYRRNKYLYKKILLRRFPHLFELPTKTNFGLPLNSSKFRILFRKLRVKGPSKLIPRYYSVVNPMINYVDFFQDLQNRSDLKKVVFENLQDLKSRAIFEPDKIDFIWQQHQTGNVNLSRNLLLLASLEVILKVFT